MMMTHALFLLFLATHGSAFIAYECGDGATNYTAISLLDVAECDVRTEIVDETDVLVQLLQTKESRPIHAIACKVSINYIAVHCGMHSHNSIVKGGVVSRMLPMSRNECDDIHHRGMYTAFGKTWNRLRSNETFTTPVTFSGSNSPDGGCTGAYFSDSINAWDNVMVEGSITITASDYYAPLRFDKKEIKLQDGTTCDMDSHECIDHENGYTFWDIFTNDDCSPNAFHVLYRGQAKRAKVYDKSLPNEITYIYTVSTQNTLFTLSSASERPFCFFSLRNTDHPKLLIHEVKSENFYFTKNAIETDELDMFLYINAKFVHLDRTLKRAMRSMYQEIMEQKCELERTTLKTQLTIAITSPLEFAYEFMNGPGYTATVLGETIYIIKCQPVEVRSVEHTECVKELPVSHVNKTRYMLPRSRILQDSSTPISCSTILKPQYLLGNNWYYSINSLHSSVAPDTLKPHKLPQWKEFGLDSIATAGIYSTSQLDDLRHQIMSPLERRAKTERMAGMINGEAISGNGLNLSSLVDKDYLENEINSFWNKCWNSFWYFGTTSAGIIGLMLAFKTIKFIFDTIVHGFALYEIYGLTWHLCGSLWDAVTTYLLHRASTGRRNVPQDRPPSRYEAVSQDKNYNMIDHLEIAKIYPDLTATAPQESPNVISYRINVDED